MEEKEIVPVKKENSVPPPTLPSDEDRVKLTLQPMHDNRKVGEIPLTGDEVTRMDELPPSDEQKLKEAEALAKVLLLEKESEKSRDFPGIIMPWKLSLAVLLIILFFIVLHFAFSLFAPKGGF